MLHRAAGMLLLWTLVTVTPAHTQVTEGDSLALVTFYNAMDGPNWVDNTGWLAGPVGTWFGISVSAGRVSEIEFNGNGLVGEIPVEVASLDSLEALRLFQDDGLTGPIPPELGGLSKLWDLQLYRAGFTGTIPEDLGKLSKLERLFLLDNELTGTIPTEILEIEPLRDLLIDQNDLEGEIPTEIGNLVNLERLWLGTSNLSGPVPGEIGKLSKLRNLFIQNSALEGELPQELTELGALTHFRWNNTELCQPTNEEFLAWIQGLSESTGTGVFCGGGPPPVADGDSLALVAFYDSLGGPDWVDNGGWLTDPVGDWSGVTLENGRVTQIILSGNGLSGSIPNQIADLDGLKVLSISNDTLQGPLPEKLWEMENLTYLALNNTVIGGTIPAEVGQLVKLTTLSFDGNDMMGAIPAEVGNLEELRGLFLSRNELSGPIPATFSNLTKLTRLEMAGNALEGPLPAGLADMTGLRDLSLSSNQISGGLPSFLGDLTELRRIFLSSNLFEGEVPESFGNLTELNTLSIGSNQGLSGPLPTSLVNLENLDAFFFSSTNLCEPPDEAFQMWLDSVATVNSTGVVCTSVAVEDASDLPATYRLGSNYPNPFNPTTNIEFDLPERARVRLSVYDMLGREVRVLIDGVVAAGRYSRTFDAGGLPSGLYLYRLTSPTYDGTGTMVLTK